MTLVDSVGWIEYATDGPLASAYAAHLKMLEQVVTPTIVVYEVYKVIKGVRSEEEALAAMAQLGKTRLVPLTDAIALMAADVSLEHRLGMADAIVYATALAESARLVTSDHHLAHLPGVLFLEKPSP